MRGGAPGLEDEEVVCNIIPRSATGPDLFRNLNKKVCAYF